MADSLDSIRAYYDRLIDDGTCDGDIIRILRNESTCSARKQYYMDLLWKRHGKMAGKAWNTLLSQLKDSSSILSLRNEFLSEAREEMYKAVLKIRADEVDSKWHFSHFYKWVLLNQKNRWLQAEKNKALSLDYNPATEDEGENGWLMNQSFNAADLPSYDSSREFERIESEIDIKRALTKCFSVWNPKRKLIFKELAKGNSRIEISKKLGCSYSNISFEIHQMKEDFKRGMAY